MEHGTGGGEAGPAGARGADETPGTGGSLLASQPIAGTGEPRVDAALFEARQLAGLPVVKHPAVFERTHQRLQAVLGELDATEHEGS
jgi:hypothetical protein